MSSSTATTTTTAGSAPVDRFSVRGPGTSVPGPLVVRAAAPRAVRGRRWRLEWTRGRGAERGRDVAASGKDPRTREAPVGGASRHPGSVTGGGRRTRTARCGFRGLVPRVRVGRTGDGCRGPWPRRAHVRAARRKGRPGSRRDGRMRESARRQRRMAEPAAAPGARVRCSSAGAGERRLTERRRPEPPGGLGPSGGSAAQVPSVPRYRPITAGSSMSSRPVPV